MTKQLTGRFGPNGGEVERFVGKLGELPRDRWGRAVVGASSRRVNRNQDESERFRRAVDAAIFNAGLVGVAEEAEQLVWEQAVERFDMKWRDAVIREEGDSLVIEPTEALVAEPSDEAIHQEAVGWARDAILAPIARTFITPAQFMEMYSAFREVIPVETLD